MGNILVTGSVDGIGRRTAAHLVARGHRVVLHARNEERAAVAKAALPAAEAIVVGDLGSIEETTALARSLSGYGRLDAVVHNAGIARLDAPARELTRDRLESTFQVNVLAPYLLTALLPRPGRLVFVSSAMAADGVSDLTDLRYDARPWNGVEAYCTSKLLDLALAFAVARRWPDVLSNAVDPGWVRTRMGGDAAPTSPDDAARAQARLAVGTGPDALVSGAYVSDRDWRPERGRIDPVADELLARCAELTGVALPG
ncbi:SDR family NAD(P)-dependent oxidoreductase [Micromonospora sp. WMMD998]|uniref:SDR family NAD(P)-dependent oxidoreductase n=1 Tax=Micromonospora sp. WMMD998 TaxID=3016092 RepID=UPI00249C8835|nr:SDR family NAD(P)-dependent oxidoreductase [Micromonospora sp. WMMD998]WFE39893.1 SDR family NAD(P)-dependent oxidoreductase [Micromonospora sp. WMMD998]